MVRSLITDYLFGALTVIAAGAVHCSVWACPNFEAHEHHLGTVLLGLNRVISAMLCGAVLLVSVLAISGMPW